MEEKSNDNENQSKKHVNAVTNHVISPSLKPSPKTNAERQREYRLRKKRRKLQNDNGDKPVKTSKAEYNRQYRLKKKVEAKLNSDFAKIFLRQEVGPSEYLIPVPTAQLTQLSPDAGPTIKQHEAVIEITVLPETISDVISPSSKPPLKTNAERQREYRLRKKRQKLQNNNGDKPIKTSKAEYYRQYRLKKKMEAKMNSDLAKIVLRQEVRPSEYPTPITTAPLMQLSPNAGPTIIQHETVTVYISVNKKVEDVIDFLHESLLAYTERGSKLLKKRYYELPLILGGDFNIQFDTDEGLRCVQFLKKELNLDFISGNTLGMTRYGTSIDGIFSRYVNHSTSDVHLSYFSYYKPIATVINNDITVIEINNVQDNFNIKENCHYNILM